MTNKIQKLENKLKIKIKNKILFETALTHKSANKKNNLQYIHIQIRIQIGGNKIINLEK